MFVSHVILEKSINTMKKKKKDSALFLKPGPYLKFGDRQTDMGDVIYSSFLRLTE